MVTTRENDYKAGARKGHPGPLPKSIALEIVTVGWPSSSPVHRAAGGDG